MEQQDEQRKRETKSGKSAAVQEFKTYWINEDETTWLRRGHLKRETEALLIATHNNPIRTNLINCQEIRHKERAMNMNYVETGM